MEKQKLPNATAVLILGILSIVTCCCFGIFGLILSTIAIILANKDLKLYRENPELYTNYKNLNTGKIISIIGFALSLICTIKFSYDIYVMSWDGFQESINEFSKAYNEAKQKQ